MNDKIKEIVREEESAEDALSNTVFITDDKVVKIYSQFPVTSLYPTILEILNGNFVYVNKELRMKKEQEIKSEVREAGFKAPDIISVGKDSIIFEKISGVSGYDYLNNCSGEEARKFGEVTREFLGQLHSRDTALRDCRISNFMVDNGEIYSLDHEYASTGAGKLFKFLDGLTIVSSARQTENYHEFIEGFQPDKVTLFLSFFTSILHNLLFQREIPKLKKVLRSVR